MRALNEFSTMVRVYLWKDAFICANMALFCIIVWANNGDMISRMYAGTSALKGDFTR